MEAQKTITIAYDVSPYRIFDILRNANNFNADRIRFMSWSQNADGRLFLALEQYLKHTEKIDKICYFLYDQTYITFPGGTLAGLRGKVHESDIDIWLPLTRMSETWMQ